MSTTWTSPNHGARPAGVDPSLIVLHGTAGTDLGDMSWLCSPDSRVSYHYLITRDGTVHQLVQESRRAWHAGPSTWNGRGNVNDFSIGVAFSNLGPRDGEPEVYPTVQLLSGARLVADIMARWGIGLDGVVTHAMVSPGRKQDPWAHFPMPWFRRMLAHYLAPPPAPFEIEIDIPAPLGEP